MFHKIFRRQFSINLHSDAPLLRERLCYLEYFQRHGSSILGLQRIAQILYIIVNCLDLENNKTITITEITKSFRELSHQSRNHKNGRTILTSTKNTCIGHAIRWLKMIGRLDLEKKYPFAEQLSLFKNYQHQEKGLLESTIKASNFILKCFFKYFSKKSCCLNDLRAQDIDDFFVYKQNIGWSRCTIQGHASIIRNFLKYAEAQKWCKQGLSASIRCPRIYTQETLPFGPSWDDVKSLLAATEGNRCLNIRDRAILMLLAIYGLRRKEVANLQLDDLDWSRELIYIRRVKNTKPQIFPLSKIVGDAILNYLKKVRVKNCLYREIFLRIKAPYKPLATGTISTMVTKHLKPLNLPIQHHSAHALRHACASHLMQEENISLKEISEHLGHKNLETTRIYAKVDIKGLRKVADFDMGDIL